MLNNAETSASKRLWNVQDLLKYNKKPQPSSLIKNIEQAKQFDATKNTIEITSEDEDRIPRTFLRPRTELDNSRILIYFSMYLLLYSEGDLPKLIAKKELQPLVHKPSKPNNYNILQEIQKEKLNQ